MGPARKHTRYAIAVILIVGMQGAATALMAALPGASMFGSTGLPGNAPVLFGRAFAGEELASRIDEGFLSGLDRKVDNHFREGRELEQRLALRRTSRRDSVAIDRIFAGQGPGQLFPGLAEDSSGVRPPDLAWTCFRPKGERTRTPVASAHAPRERIVPRTRADYYSIRNGYIPDGLVGSSPAFPSASPDSPTGKPPASFQLAIYEARILFFAPYHSFIKTAAGRFSDRTYVVS